MYRLDWTDTIHINDTSNWYSRQGWGQFNSGIGIAGQFQFQFRNWNWNWNWWNWKWNWNWKPWNWNWNWKPELNFLQLLPQHLLVNQAFPNLSFNHVNRGGYDLSCDWLLMQQVCSWDIAPLWCGHKRHGEGTLFPLSRQRPEGLKMVTIICLPPWETKLLSLLNKWMISELGVKLSPNTTFSLILLIGILRSLIIVIIHWDKCHRTLLINLMINPHCIRWLICSLCLCFKRSFSFV